MWGQKWPVQAWGGMGTDAVGMGRSNAGTGWEWEKCLGAEWGWDKKLPPPSVTL